MHSIYLFELDIRKYLIHYLMDNDFAYKATLIVSDNFEFNIILFDIIMNYMSNGSIR